MKRTRLKATISVALLAIVAMVAFVLFVFRTPPAQQAAKLIRQASLMAAKGNMEEAEPLARQAVALDPKLSAAHRLAAEGAIARGAFEQALTDLYQISPAAKEDWRWAQGQAADLLHHRVFRLSSAERIYQDILAVAPDDGFANDGYARLLGVCGRRTEAIPHVLRLIRAGQKTDLLMLLSRESGSLDNPELLESARQADHSDPNPLLGQAHAAAQRQQHAKALDKLRLAAKLDGLPSDFDGKLGQQLLANEQFEDLSRWAQDVPTPPRSVETWLVLAELAERQDDPRGAVRCYWEALRMRPESRSATSHLARLLTLLSQPEAAAVFHRRLETLNELRSRQQLALMSAQTPDDSVVIDMVRAYEAAGRIWEAVAFARIAANSNIDAPALPKMLSSLETRLSGLPLVMTNPDDNPALHIDLSQFELPSLKQSMHSTTSAVVSTDISFQLQGTDVGFDFRFYNGANRVTHRMFEFGGGGVGVIDFDHDGAPDLFCTQGLPWEASVKPSRPLHDCLFRNGPQRQFAEVWSNAFDTEDRGFGQGVSAGDFNNDGFADLYVAQTAANQLWLNNGDGTFTKRTDTTADHAAEWTTSCLIADVNNDSLPDLYDVNYLSGDDVFDRVCASDSGEIVMCSPIDFAAAPDLLRLNDGAGGLRASEDFLTPPPLGKGLGIAAFNRGDNSLSLFVANDTVANFYYTAASPNAPRLTESAVLSGVAFNADGKAEACMGVAAADCNQDGRIDLFVTNFLYESNTLYSPLNDQLFVDSTKAAGVHEPSLPVLGWGTQFLDANLDGRHELFVSNGHTDDLSGQGVPYEMRPQMFEWTGHQFQQLSSEQLGPWSSVPVVGRAAARLDWNNDGYPDLVVNTLDASSLLLTNTAAAESNRFLSLSLVATESARDAIGTTVVVTIGKKEYYHQLTAGDGFQCSNERRLLIGCGAAQKIDAVVVAWPSGKVQTHRNVPTNRRMTAVEGREVRQMP